MDFLSVIIRYPFYPFTLATGYRVALRDDTGEEYREMLTSGRSGCGTVSPEGLKVLWTASYGVFADSSAAGAATSPSLAVLVTKPVYFKPRGPGPWSITVTVGADVGDPHAKTFQWTDPITGLTRCYRENSLHLNISRTFLVQLPRFEAQDATTQTMKLLR